MPVTYPGSGVTITVEALLKQPRLIARALTSLTAKRFVADSLFARGTPDQVASGAVLYQRSESIYTTADAQEVGIRAEFPRTGWTEAVFAAMVHKYGLEVPIADEAKRRNALDVMARAQRKLANSVIKFVDTLAMTLLTTDANVLSGSTSGVWSSSSTDKVADIGGARKAIFDQDEGYEPDTLVISPTQELQMITDKNIRDALPREQGNGVNSIVTGQAVPILGLRQILVTPRLAAGTVIVANAKVSGSIADEQTLPDEGYVSYNPGVNAQGEQFAPVLVKVYREENTDETIVRGARLPAMWLGEPKSVYVMTGA